MEKDELLFFKTNGYKRFFQELRKKWESYGKFLGKIKIKNLSSDERKAIGSFLGRYIGESEIELRCREVEEALARSKFKNISLYQLLEKYFNEKITTKKEKKEFEEKRKKESLKKILKILESENILDEKIEFILNKIEKNYNYEIEEVLLNSLRAIDYLGKSKNKIKLAMLANKITTNPHYFDKGGIGGSCLIQCLSILEGKEVPNDRESLIELYFKNGIEGDTISSFTVAFGIRLFGELGKHLAYREFIKNRELT